MSDLDNATKDFAGRRMNRAIAKAIAGKNVMDVEKTVEHALGIEAAHEKGGKGGLPIIAQAAGEGRK